MSTSGSHPNFQLMENTNWSCQLIFVGHATNRDVMDNISSHSFASIPLAVLSHSLPILPALSSFLDLFIFFTHFISVHLISFGFGFGFSYRSSRSCHFQKCSENLFFLSFIFFFVSFRGFFGRATRRGR